MMPITPAPAIEDEAGLDAAIARIDALLERERTPDEEHELDVLSTLVEAYEALHHAIDPPTTRELVAYQVATLGLTARDLAPAMGSIASARALLAGRRQPTPGQAAELAKVLRLPVDELLGDDGPGGAARLGR